MPLDYTKHKTVMLQILKDIYSDTSIAPFLGFKGGTAAYLFYQLNRFSVDLDFDLLQSTAETAVFERMEQILKKYGEVKESRKKRYSLFFLLSYQKDAQSIKIEINLRNFGSRYETKSYLGIAMVVMVQADMFSHKLIAMSERLGKTNRDIYDVWFFLNNHWPINKSIVESRTNMPFKKFLKECIANLDKLNERHILNGVGELLDQKQRDWTKANLKKDTVFLLKLMLENEKV